MDYKAEAKKRIRITMGYTGLVLVDMDWAPGNPNYIYSIYCAKCKLCFPSKTVGRVKCPKCKNDERLGSLIRDWGEL